jgi:hypothetical protein
MTPDLERLRQYLRAALLDCPWVDAKSMPGEVDNTADICVDVVRAWRDRMIELDERALHLRIYQLRETVKEQGIENARLTRALNTFAQRIREIEDEEDDDAKEGGGFYRHTPEAPFLITDKDDPGRAR